LRKASCGQARWTLRLLADKLVELKVVESVSLETVRQKLKKRPATTPQRVLVHPAEGQRGVVCAMETCLKPINCPTIPKSRRLFDERPVQLIADITPPLPPNRDGGALGHARASGLRIRALRNGQRVFVHRAAGRWRHVLSPRIEPGRTCSPTPLVGRRKTPAGRTIKIVCDN